MEHDASSLGTSKLEDCWSTYFPNVLYGFVKQCDLKIRTTLGLMYRVVKTTNHRCSDSCDRVKVVSQVIKVFVLECAFVTTLNMN